MAQLIWWFPLAVLILAAGGASAATTNASSEYLDAHNKARAEVGVGPLKWSSSLANATSLRVRYQRDNMSCGFADLGGSRYGGNQLRSSGAAETPREAVEFWVSEKQYYNHTDNTCAAGRQCGVYTQVVWRNSLELGCAQATCPKDKSSITICFYNPPGNIVGQSPY